jgi:hypothetical protein
MLNLKKAIKLVGGEKYVCTLSKGLKLKITPGAYKDTNTWEREPSDKLSVNEQLIYMTNPQIRFAVEHRIGNWVVKIATPVELETKIMIPLYPLSIRLALYESRVETHPLRFIYAVTTDKNFNFDKSPVYNLECYVSPIADKRNL